VHGENLHADGPVCLLRMAWLTICIHTFRGTGGSFAGRQSGRWMTLHAAATTVMP
jgi:hypothetical protein